MAEEENKEEIEKEIQDTSSDSSEEIETQEVQDDNNLKEEKDTKQKQVPILNKILFGVVGFLILILITGIVLYLVGFFDPEEKPKENTGEVIQEKIVEETNTFNIKDINSKKLNKQLLLLTNKNIIEEEANNKREKELEEKKIKEAEEKKKEEAILLEEENLSKEKELLENKKLELEKQKEELEFLKNEAIALREEMLIHKELMQNQKEEIIRQEEEVVQEVEAKQIEEVVENKKEVIIKEVPPILEESKFVSLINVAKIKGNLLKSYLDKVTSIYDNVKLCRDDLNRIEIYYGPFKDDKYRNEIYKKLQDNGIVNSYEVELTNEEFQKRCNY